MTKSLLALASGLLLTVAPIHGARAQYQRPSPRTRVVERHPRMESAIRELEGAKVELQKAPHDFGGHRVQAIQAVDRAIEQLRLALKYDRN